MAYHFLSNLPFLSLYHHEKKKLIEVVKIVGCIFGEQLRWAFLEKFYKVQTYTEWLVQYAGLLKEEKLTR